MPRCAAPSWALKGGSLIIRDMSKPTPRMIGGVARRRGDHLHQPHGAGGGDRLGIEGAFLACDGEDDRTRRGAWQRVEIRNAIGGEGDVVERDSAIGGGLAENEREFRVALARDDISERRDLRLVLQVFCAVERKRRRDLLLAHGEQQLRDANRFGSAVARGGCRRRAKRALVGAEAGIGELPVERRRMRGRLEIEIARFGVVLGVRGFRRASQPIVRARLLQRSLGDLRKPREMALGLDRDRSRTAARSSRR